MGNEPSQQWGVPSTAQATQLGAGASQTYNNLLNRAPDASGNPVSTADATRQLIAARNAMQGLQTQTPVPMAGQRVGMPQQTGFPMWLQQAFGNVGQNGLGTPMGGYPGFGMTGTAAGAGTGYGPYGGMNYGGAGQGGFSNGQGK